jgi:hypothetical protein
MVGYRRTTRECFVNQLNPILLQAFQDYFLEHKLGNPAEETLLCCETFTEKENAGRIETWLSGNQDSTDYLGIILTKERLFWALTGDRFGTKAFGANLKDIRLKPYQSRFTNETGLQIAGFLGDFNDFVKGNLALGPEEAARKFCEEAVKTAEKVNPPAKKRTIPWFNRP